ncbi:MAG: cob(I)yrinic acid a,c-diamide adenosyltransferase [Saprospiraceae bacterium]
MKIYTKTGDKGKTSLFGGSRVSKAHIRIDAYGNVDELNSYIGLLRDLVSDKMLVFELMDIQRVLFSIGSHLAADPSKSNLWLPNIDISEIEKLEKSVDRMEEILPTLAHFILPGGHPSVSHCHIARCVCRRAERRVVQLSEIDETNDILIQYLNRLSDYIFVLSRYIAYQEGAEELKWESGR